MYAVRIKVIATAALSTVEPHNLHETIPVKKRGRPKQDDVRDREDGRRRADAHGENPDHRECKSRRAAEAAQGMLGIQPEILEPTQTPGFARLLAERCHRAELE